jgi:Ca-activated chloride channel homolog
MWVRLMQVSVKQKKLLEIAALLVLLFLAAPAALQNLHAGNAIGESQEAESTPGHQIQIPNRESRPLFEGQQGKQRTEIYFDPTTRLVTLKLLVQDPNGYFIPSIRRDNFVVYENGLRQQNVTVEIEHAPVSLGMLIEFGGRAQALNRMMGMEVARAAHQVLDVLGQADKIAVWKYNDKVEKVADFSQGHETLDHVFEELGTPQFSETNLYDAVIYTVEQMRPVKGRKAMILISSGIDTFSKAKYEDALNAARASDTPIYVISLTRELHALVDTYENAGALARINWDEADRELQEIARASGGRAYSPGSTIDLAGIYDDMMENLRVRYVVTYRSSSNLDLNSPRTVRVELVDPKTGGPLKIIDQSGRTIHANIILEQRYVPNSASVSP